VGGLAAQLFPSRSAANGATTAVLLIGLLVRMVGDGVAALSWLRWLSPFGLLALTHPYDTNRGLPIAVLGTAGVVVFAAAVRSAAQRDVGGAVFAPSTGRNPRRALLGSVPAFALRRSLRPLAGWAVGVGAYFLLIGLIARSMTDFLADNPQFAQLAAQAGFAELGTVEGYAATLFALLAIPAGVLVAVRLATVAADEADRRLVLLLAAPLTRTRLLAAEAGAATGGAVVLITVAGMAAWAGTVAVGAGLPVGSALAGAWNVLPIVLLCLGAAILALGWAPRAVAAIGVLPAAGGFLWQVIAVSIGAPAWIGELSPFAHLAAVPTTTPDWTGAAVMTAIAVGCAALGAYGYQRRDLRT
jgi:ABC-2 type transport system permease protein